MARRQFALTTAQRDRLAATRGLIVKIRGDNLYLPNPSHGADVVWRALGAELGFEWETATFDPSDKTGLTLTAEVGEGGGQ